MIYVDGAEQPQLQGTGSEDYFCGAWAYSEPFSNLYFGCPLIVGGHVRNALWNVYRYHLEDPIPFTKSIKVTIEHGHANNRKDDFSSVAYWYQNEPHKAFSPLAPAEDRLPSEATVYTEDWVTEFEDLAKGFQNEKVVAQPTQSYGNYWSGGSQLLFKADGPETFKTILPTGPGDGLDYMVELWYTAGPDYGRAELWMNGKKLCGWDGYNPSCVVRKMLYEKFPMTLKASDNILELRVTGKNEASSGFLAGLDCYRTTP
jgi:hypothetical protein